MWKCPPKILGSPNAGISIALLIVLSLAHAQPAAKRKPRLDPGDLPPIGVHVLHSAVTRVEGACVSFHGSLSDSWRLIVAGDFFGGLKRVDTPNGPIFRKGSQAVTDFPDEVYLRAYSGVSRCSKGMKYLGPWPTATPDFLRGLHAEAVYVRDLHRYPVEISQVEEGAVYVAVAPLLQDPTWYYLWVLKTKGVRLTDSLIVDLFSNDGTKVGQFTVDLAGRTGLW